MKYYIICSILYIAQKNTNGSTTKEKVTIFISKLYIVHRDKSKHSLNFLLKPCYCVTLRVVTIVRERGTQANFDTL